MLYVETGSTDPYYNFGLEYWLITEKLLEDDTVFLFWRTEPTLMIGKYQNPYEEINIEYARSHHINIVRRMSGGGTIYTDMGGWQFTFITKGDSKRISFSEYILPVIDALHSLGVSDAGFNGRNDLVIGGRKFSGNAQYMHGGYTLHHGSLLYDTDIEQMVAATNVDPYKIISKSIKSVRDRVTNISEHLENPVSAEVFKELMVSNIMRGSHNVYIPTSEEQQRIEQIAEERFRNHRAVFGLSPKYSIVRTGRFEGGKMEFNIRVVKGCISDIAVSGDFFGTVEAEDFASVLRGCEYERSAVEAALEKLPGTVYQVTAAEMAKVIVE